MIKLKDTHASRQFINSKINREQCNVRTMYKTDKVYHVAKEMKKLRHAILGVSETRWTVPGMSI